MNGMVRSGAELLLLAGLAGVLLIAVIAATRFVFDDEKSQYFVIGYYCAIHNDLARWIWKRLRFEKQESSK